MNQLAQYIRSADIMKNIKAGLTVSLIAIPLSISLAVASGATPLQGILTAIWACVIAGFFGGSQYNIFGPAGALTALLTTFVMSTQDQLSFPVLAIAVAIVVGVIALLRITKYITLIPTSVLHGFIAGVSLTIASGQLGNIFGITVPASPHMLQHLETIGTHIASGINRLSVAIFTLGYIFLMLWKKYIKSVPASIPLIVLGAIIGFAFDGGYIAGNIRILGDQFPNLSFQLWDLQWFGYARELPHMGIAYYKMLFTSATVIAVVSVLETMISAKVGDKMTSTRFSQPKEMRGLALANLVSGFTGGIPTSAVLIRTALNINSGATSSIAAIATGLFTAGVSWVAFRYLAFIPMAIIAAILVHIAWSLLSFGYYKKVLKYELFSGLILVVVALVTWLVDPIYGILLGVFLAILVYLRRVINVAPLVTVFRNGDFFAKTSIIKYKKTQQLGDIVIMKIIGDITFLSVNDIIEGIDALTQKQVVVLSLSGVGHIDIDGVEALEELITYFHAHQIDYYVTGLSNTLKRQLTRRKIYHGLEEQQRIYFATAQILEKLLSDDMRVKG